MTTNNPFSQDTRQKKLNSPEQIGSTLKITALPTYLLALTALLLLGAFSLLNTLSAIVLYQQDQTSEVIYANHEMEK